MGFKSKATKMNKAKKEARVKPVKRACSGHTWGGIATHQHVNEWGKSGSVGKGGDPLEKGPNLYVAFTK